VPRELLQLKKKLGERLRERRKERRLSQEQLAFEAEISPSYLSQVEAGQRNPSLETLYRLTLALDLELKDLF
jgi:transcriptional regulator with XRE-family HTH domain